MELQLLNASLVSAKLENENRRNEFQRLSRDAVLYGYDVATNVPYDGNCFFSSILHHLDRPLTAAAEVATYLVTKVGLASTL